MRSPCILSGLGVAHLPHLVGLLILLTSACCLVVGQNQTTPTETCKKCKNGNSLVSLIVKEPKPQCLSGHFFAVLRNTTDCECDFLCARASGQACFSALLANNQSLCDSTFRLACDVSTNSCLGPLSLAISNIRHNSLYLYWNRIHNDTQVYVSPHSSHFPNGVTFELVNSTNFNFGKHQLSTKITALRPNTTYIFKVVAGNGKEEFTVAKTIESEFSEPLPNVIVTSKNASSIGIAFDDFKPPNYKAGYVIHYRMMLPSWNENWNTIQSNNTPVYLITNLRPNTNYQVQVFIWDHFGDKIGISSDIVNTSTLEGCLHNQTVYNVGTKIVENCEQVCFCVSHSTIDCIERCPAPKMSAKEAHLKGLECPAIDKCCVKCLPTTTALPKFVDKPGLCPPPPPPPPPPTASGISLCSNTSSNSECQHDYHCTGVHKCCSNGCDRFSCQAPINSTLHKVNSTSHECGGAVKCGENALCRLSEQEGEDMPSFKCICRDGFVSEEPIKGCQPKSNQQPGKVPATDSLHQCLFNGTSYRIAQRWRTECKDCVCSEALEVECTPVHCECNRKGAPMPLDDSECCRATCDNSNDNADEKTTGDLDNNNSTTISANANTTTALEGCRYLNETIAIGRHFNIGCESRCLCKARGEVECRARCSENPGFDEKLCVLVQDPDDECCKISVCDHSNTTQVKGRPEMLIEMAEAINSTTIKLKLLYDSSTDLLQGELNYVQMFPNMTEQDPSKLDWNTIKATNLSMQPADESNSLYIFLENLLPKSDYFIFFKVHTLHTNMVIVRTFPPGIDNTYKGCFHGNQILKVGEVFYEGDCEYKCTCQEDGIRECEERCPRYKDLIGYEHCRWEQSAEDPCCSEPVCDEDSHQSSKQCVTEDRKVYQIGDTWLLGNGCQKKKCECHLNREHNIAEIECHGGCPIIPEAILKPNSDCASPRLIKPQDPCMCSYVVCSDNINPLDLPEKPEKSPSLKHCQFKGNQISIGEEFYDNCRAVCRCDEGGVLNCKPIQCNAKFGPHITAQCLEWEIDANFIPMPPNCCPEPKCKNDGSCSFAGIRFPNHKQIPQELLPCGKRCVCQNGQINCENMCPEIPDTPPLGLNCPPAFAFRGHLPGDDCCIYWQCRNIYQDKIKGNCIYKEKRFKLGEQWDELDTGIKRRCECRLSSGIMHITCNPGNCQPITGKYLEPTAECRIPAVVIPKDPVMCPYVICNNTQQEGELLDNVDVVAINATSARIRFTIPALYVGLLGHAEVHYTTDLNIPRHQWNIQKFARPKRLFDIPNIEYHLGNLKPDTTYFLQIEIIIEALKSGPASEIYKLYLPSMPALRETVTQASTSTTTLPPIIMLDMSLSAGLVDDSSAKVSWRAFTTQEKKYIDGMQLRYQISNSGRVWSHTPVLHRNTTSYVLHNLRPGKSYAIDLLFITTENVNSNIVSTKPLVFEVPDHMSSTYGLHIMPSDVVVNQDQVDILLHNMSKPLDKYINVAKVFYQDLETMKLMSKFITIDVEASRISFSNLPANTRYKMWIDLYLTNGQVVSTNTFDVVTSEGGSALAASSSSSATLFGTKYLLPFLVISLIIFLAGAFFLLTTCYIIRKNNSAALNRVRISEAAYDNPTYKTFEGNGKCEAPSSVATLDPKKD